jgi:hypothetical protein
MAIIATSLAHKPEDRKVLKGISTGCEVQLKLNPSFSEHIRLSHIGSPVFLSYKTT